MAKTQILEYTIHLRDAALVKTLQAQLAAGQGPGQLLALPTGGLAVYRAPNGASIEFGSAAGGTNLPLITVGRAIPQTGSGYITSGWFTSPPSLQTDVATFTRDTGWWIFGSHTKFYWAGQFALAPGGVATGSPDPPLPTPGLRYWLHGFEEPFDGDVGGVAGSGIPVLQRHCRAASRTGDGLGARGILGDYAGAYEMFTGSGLRPPRTTLTEMWERFYVRPLRYGSSTLAIWSTHDNHSSGFEIAVTPTGQWALFSIASTNPEDLSLIATFGQSTLGAWTRFDVCFFIISTSQNRIEVRVNGALVAEGIGPAGLVITRVWGDSSFGPAAGILNPTSYDLEADFDDWVGGAVPVDPAEYARGSHIVRVVPNGIGPNHNPAWVGDIRALQAAGHLQGNVDPGFTTTTPSAVLEVTLPLATRVENHPQALGIAAWRVLVFVAHRTPGTLPGQFGYQVGEATPVLTTATGESIITEYEGMTGQPADGALLSPGTSLRLRYVKAAETAVCDLSALCVLVELSGTFGPEDGPATGPEGYPPPVPVHQAPFPRSPWARDRNPMGAVIVVSGTYVGNGTGQDLLFKLPPTWLLIRPPATVAHEITRWWPSMLWANHNAVSALQFGAGPALVENDDAFVPSDPDADQQFQVRVRLTGTPTHHTNDAGLTYHYCALLDPAARFSRAFGTAARPVGTSPIPGVPRTWPLDDLQFQPEAGLLVNEFTLGTAAPYYLWKTPGHAAADASEIGAGTGIPGGLTFATGAVTIGPGLVDDQADQTAGLFFRRLDGNVDAPRVLFLGSYVGDGAASRTVSFGATGRRPLYAHIGPVNVNVAHYHRDPGHTGTNSTQLGFTSGAQSTTAITAGGPDSFTVGSTLNGNGVTYGYWGLYGSTAAGNNGWSTDGEFVTPADSNKPPGWEEPEPLDPDDGDGGGPDPGDHPGPVDPGAPGSDIFAECVEASTRIVNLALSEIGITKQITSLGATTDTPPVWIDNSQEAYAARMIYRTLVDTVLRDDEWAFTREYATLTATAGSVASRVNPDWTYSYTLPLDCLRVKRVCVPTDQRRYTTSPVAFDRRATDLGQVDMLLCNEPGGGLLPPPKAGDPVTITIEYAKRISCPARVTDSQFRECLVFRLAAGLAKALARDSADADRCLRNYSLARPRGLVNQANDQEPQRPIDGLPSWLSGR